MKQTEQSTPAFFLPPLQYSLEEIFAELKSIGNQRLDEGVQNPNENNQEIKGLKFIANKIGKLFEKNKKFQYNQITKILVDIFSHEDSQSRNIKRRIYDAINVMVATGVLEKNKDFIEKSQEGQSHSDQLLLKEELENTIRVKNKTLQQKRVKNEILKNRLNQIRRLFERNQKTKHRVRIETPQVINIPFDTREVQHIKERGRRETVKVVRETAKSKRSIKKQALKATLSILEGGQYAQYF